MPFGDSCSQAFFFCQNCKLTEAEATFWLLAAFLHVRMELFDPAQAEH